MGRGHQHADQPNDSDDKMFDASAEAMNSAAVSALRSYVERCERLIEDRNAVNTDIKEVLTEAKGNGFDTKIIRKAIQIRSKDKAKRQEEEALLDLYLLALGEK